MLRKIPAFAQGHTGNEWQVESQTPGLSHLVPMVLTTLMYSHTQMDAEAAGEWHVESGLWKMPGEGVPVPGCSLLNRLPRGPLAPGGSAWASGEGEAADRNSLCLFVVP